MRIRGFCILLLLLSGQIVFGQASLGIGTDNPDPEAIMDIVSTDRGILIPRMTIVERDTNLTPLLGLTDEGLFIYNNSSSKFNYWDGIQWIDFPAVIGGSDTDWSINGDDVYKDIGTATIGTNTIAGWPFNVVNSAMRRSINIAHNYDGNLASDAVYILVKSSAPTGLSAIRGIYSQAEKDSSSNSSGEVNGSYNWGINSYQGATYSDVAGNISLGYKFYGTSGNAYGIRSEAYNESGGVAYGIFSTVGSVGSFATLYAGFFAGDVFVTGAFTPSDRSLKQDITTARSSLEKIIQLPVSSYRFKADQIPHMNLPRGLQTGFLAEDINELFPELVKDATMPSPSQASIDAGIYKPADEVDFKAVNYSGLIPHLVKAIQEQQELIKSLEERIRMLEDE